MTRTHIIGAGLAGLAAALSCAEAGHRVTLYEAGPAAGGRCRSYDDRALGCRIDNGNHLLLSGNDAAMAFLDQIGARSTLGGPDVALFPFLDLTTGARWTVRPSAGRLPWWLLQPSRRVPGARLADYLALGKLLRARPDATVAQVLGHSGALYRRLLEPLAVSALNTAPDIASAQLMAAIVRQTLMQGGAACIPRFPRIGLSESFVDPALAWLGARGGEVLTGRRVAALRIEADRVAALEMAEGSVAISPGDNVILAVPAPVAATLLPTLMVPDAFEPIVNVHYRTEAAPSADVARAGFAGLVGGTAEWVFLKPGIVSVTVSAARRLVDEPADAIAATIWPEVQRAAGCRGDMPPVRVVKERRATFAATPAQERRRPGARTGLRHFAVAGDWTATGLPATIEGAIRSGRAAAAIVLAPH